MSQISRDRVSVTVVTVGDSKVGKTSLILRFCQNSFNQSYQPTTFTRYAADNTVAGRRVHYTFWDSAGTRPATSALTLAVREADVLLLCYKISDPATLFSAINNWLPELHCHSPGTPIILVGCQSDLREDENVLTGLSKVGKYPVSAQQALSMSQQIKAVMYVETSVKTSGRDVASLMEMAALTTIRQLKNTQIPLSPLVPRRPRHRKISLSGNQKKEHSGSQESLFDLDHTPSVWDSFSYDDNGDQCSKLQSRQSRPGTRSISQTGSLRSKSSTLSSTRSASSVCPRSPQPIRINTSKTTLNKSEKTTKSEMMTIKCQRMTADNKYEEVDIEVPVAVYETLQTSDQTNASEHRTEKRGFGTKIKCLFSKTEK